MSLDENGRENVDPIPAAITIKSRVKDPREIIRQTVLREMVAYQQERLVETEEDLNDFNVFDPNDIGDEPLTPYEMVEMETPLEGELYVDPGGNVDNKEFVLASSEEGSTASDRQSGQRYGRSADGDNGQDNGSGHEKVEKVEKSVDNS